MFIKDFEEMKDSELEKYDTFLCIWPPYNKPLAYNVFKKFLELNNVKTFIYIGEGYGGCTADDDFFDLIEDNKTKETCTDEIIGFKSADFFNDYIHVFNKRK
jgi:hypothetical protein